MLDKENNKITIGNVDNLSLMERRGRAI